MVPKESTLLKTADIVDIQSTTKKQRIAHNCIPSPSSTSVEPAKQLVSSSIVIGTHNTGNINITPNTERKFKRPLSQQFVVSVPPTYCEFAKRTTATVPSVHPPAWAPVPSLHPPTWAPTINHHVIPVQPSAPSVQPEHSVLLAAYDLVKQPEQSALLKVYDTAKREIGQAKSRGARKRATKRGINKIVNSLLTNRR